MLDPIARHARIRRRIRDLMIRRGAARVVPAVDRWGRPRPCVEGPTPERYATTPAGRRHPLARALIHARRHAERAKWARAWVAPAPAPTVDPLADARAAAARFMRAVSVPPEMLGG